MNKELLSSSVQTLEAYRQSSISFNAVREKNANLNVNELENENTLFEMQTAAVKRKAELEVLNGRLSKMGVHLFNVNADALSTAVSNELTSLSNLSESISKYLDGNQDAIESIVTSLSDERKENEALAVIIQKAELDVSINALAGLQHDTMTLEEVKTIMNEMDKSSPMYRNLADLELLLENQRKKSHSEATVPKEDDERKLTLEEKLKNINHKVGAPYHTNVRTVVAEHVHEEMHKRIQNLEGKKKLTFKEAVMLHTLREQELAMQTYIENMDKSKLSLLDRGREGKLEAKASQIEEVKKSLAFERELASQYSGKIMRFFSGRRQAKLEEQIRNLQTKRGALQDKQRSSAIAKYNKDARRMYKIAKRKGTLQAVGAVVNNKIDQLKALKQQVTTELGHLKNDMRRFTSAREQGVYNDQIINLAGRQGVIPDNVISLDAYRQAQQLQRVA